MARRIKRTVKVTYRRPVIRVTRSGEACCVNCGRINEVRLGQVNPICGHCRYPLPLKTR